MAAATAGTVAGGGPDQAGGSGRSRCRASHRPRAAADPRSHLLIGYRGQQPPVPGRQWQSRVPRRGGGRGDRRAPRRPSNCPSCHKVAPGRVAMGHRRGPLGVTGQLRGDTRLRRGSGRNGAAATGGPGRPASDRGCRGRPADDPVVEPLVVAEVETLLLQDPLGVPVGLGQQDGLRVPVGAGQAMHGRPNSSSGSARPGHPRSWRGSSGGHRHGHVAADPVALRGDVGQGGRGRLPPGGRSALSWTTWATAGSPGRGP